MPTTTELSSLEIVDVQDAIAEIEAVSGFRVPSGLIPAGKAVRVAPYYFTIGIPDIDVDMDHLLGLIINDPQFFFGLPIRGFRGFGVIEYGEGSYAPAVHILEEGLKVSVCLSPGTDNPINVVMPNAQRFFDALTHFIISGTGSAWQLEACENSWMSVYKLVHHRNFGIVFEESLVNNPKPANRLNQMLAELAVSSVSEISDVTVCQDRIVMDAWLSKHPNGLFIPYWAEPDFLPKFHTNRCQNGLNQIELDPMGWCGSDDVSALADWMMKRFGKPLTACSACS